MRSKLECPKQFSRLVPGLCGYLLLSSSAASAFVHIHQLKPHLAISPSNPTVDFLWNGEAPELSEKDGVFEGAFADASDEDLMEALLSEAVNAWNRVETAYVELQVSENTGATLDENDEDFAIVVDE